MLADNTSLTFVYHVCAFLPAVGLLGGFLPTAPGKALAAKARSRRRSQQRPRRADCATRCGVENRKLVRLRRSDGPAPL